MREIVQLVRQYEAELREKLKEGRAGLYKLSDGTCQVRGGVELGTRFRDAETIYIFGNVEDLDIFFRFFAEVED